MNWKSPICRAIAAALIFPTLALRAHEPAVRARTPVQLPDIPGFLTLKCDFHIHTVFSDGYVWPTVRAEEAWREGLDVIAITDHIEYQPHKTDVSTNHNRAHQLAAEHGDELDVLVIHGSEITRKMPPGHHNAIFLTNSEPLAATVPTDTTQQARAQGGFTVTNWVEAFKAARAQGGFIFWNHPGWGPQLTQGKLKWFPEHTQLLEQDLMHGIEIVNGRDYYPDAHRWAIEKKLTLLSNSDIHLPLNLDYHVHDRDHRPLTLVFAKGRTLDAVREALFDRRTVVYSGGRLIGEERFLRPLFEASIRVLNPPVTLRGREDALVQIHNDSEVDFKLERTDEPATVGAPRELTLPARKTALVRLKPGNDTPAGLHQHALEYRVTNLLTGPEEFLIAPLRVEVRYIPATKE